MAIGSEMVEQYRLEHPESRAVSLWTYYGSSGTVRRRTCIACRGVAATSAGKYPETVRAGEQWDAHEASCHALALLGRRTASRMRRERIADEKRTVLLSIGGDVSVTHTEAESTRRACAALARDLLAVQPLADLMIDRAAAQSASAAVPHTWRDSYEHASAALLAAPPWAEIVLSACSRAGSGGQWWAKSYAAQFGGAAASGSLLSVSRYDADPLARTGRCDRLIEMADTMAHDTGARSTRWQDAARAIEPATHTDPAPTATEPESDARAAVWAEEARS